jgi:formylglycine-generating enzyme required for sulfatase activity
MSVLHPPSRSLLGSLAVALLALGATDCYKPQALKSKDPTVAEHDPQNATCSVAKDPLNPLIVEWPGANRSQLEATAARGPVVVSYVGCVMKVLPDCTAGGGSGYELTRTTPAKETLAIADEGELKARLPLGVASLGGELKQGKALELSYVSVGQRQARTAPTTVSGQCAGATHYVRSMTVGAYELATTSTFAASGGVELGGTGASGSSKDSRQRLRGSADGTVTRCSASGLRDDEVTTHCGAILQLGLVPIDAADGKVAAAGFGDGLGTVAVIPKVGELREVQVAGGLAAADPDLLELVQSAKRADKKSDASAGQRVSAWDSLSQYRGKNPYKASAEQRRDQWRAVQEAETKRAEQVAKVCAQYSADSAKLQRLLHLDDDVVSARQKEGYQRELEQVYAAWRGDIAVCEQRASRAEQAARAQEQSRQQQQAREALIGAMVSIPGGAFIMGSADGQDAEKPAHRMTVASFALDVTEVTVGAYEACVQGGGCSQPGTDQFCNWGQSGKSRHPINCVDWNQATAFCSWARKRLPTEEEWELAARGTEGRTYPWGAAGPGNQLCWKGSGASGTCEVGSHASGATPTGLQDMAGNVWEWTSSQKCPYTSSGYDMNKCDSVRISRGGGWGSGDAAWVRGALRNAHAPAYRNGGVGFRCARALLLCPLRGCGHFITCSP